MQHAPYREVPLHRRDGSLAGVALVDPERYDEVAAYTWSMNSHGYAFRMVMRNGRHESVPMHRFILGLAYGDGIHVDHVNRNRLDNRVANLRRCTHAFNTQNRGASKTWGGRPVSSRFVGVSHVRGGDRYRARVVLHGVRYGLGSFRLELDAALAVERWRQEHKPWTLPDPALVAALTERPEWG